jgi:hypothetical protein
MQTEHRQILAFLDRGEISLAEAEKMLDSTLQDKTGYDKTRLSRLKSWLGSRFGATLCAAVLAGVALQPAFAATLYAGMRVVHGPTLNILLNRLLEAYL